MANDLIWVRCRCGGRYKLLKYYPSFSYARTDGLGEWLDRHLGCEKSLGWGYSREWEIEAEFAGVAALFSQCYTAMDLGGVIPFRLETEDGPAEWSGISC